MTCSVETEMITCRGEKTQNKVVICGFPVGTKVKEINAVVYNDTLFLGHHINVMFNGSNTNNTYEEANSEGDSSKGDSSKSTTINTKKITEKPVNYYIPSPPRPTKKVVSPFKSSKSSTSPTTPVTGIPDLLRSRKNKAVTSIPSLLSRRRKKPVRSLLSLKKPKRNKPVTTLASTHDPSNGTVPTRLCYDRRYHNDVKIYHTSHGLGNNDSQKKIQVKKNCSNTSNHFAQTSSSKPCSIRKVYQWISGNANVKSTLTSDKQQTNTETSFQSGNNVAGKALLDTQNRDGKLLNIQETKKQMQSFYPKQQKGLPIIQPQISHNDSSKSLQGSNLVAYPFQFIFNAKNQTLEEHRKDKSNVITRGISPALSLQVKNQVKSSKKITRPFYISSPPISYNTKNMKDSNPKPFHVSRPSTIYSSEKSDKPYLKDIPKKSPKVLTILNENGLKEKEKNTDGEVNDEELLAAVFQRAKEGGPKRSSDSNAETNITKKAKFESADDLKTLEWLEKATQVLKDARNFPGKNIQENQVSSTNDDATILDNSVRTSGNHKKEKKCKVIDNKKVLIDVGKENVTPEVFNICKKNERNEREKVSDKTVGLDESVNLENSVHEKGEIKNLGYANSAEKENTDGKTLNNVIDMVQEEEMKQEKMRQFEIECWSVTSTVKLLIRDNPGLEKCLVLSCKNILLELSNMYKKELITS